MVDARTPVTAQERLTSVSRRSGAVAHPETESGRRQEAGHMALRTRPKST
jgi:hypothetical protein